MLVVLSPAKDLDFSNSPHEGLEFSAPHFVDEAAKLAKATKRLSRRDIINLMGVSEKLADLNYQRFQALSPDDDSLADHRMAAAFAFAGDVYRGLEARTLTRPDLEFAQTHLRHLSGLYGLLRPLDAIEPYRLEMGSKLKTRRGANLYDFWGDRIAKALDADLANHEDKVVINLASDEYARAIDRKALKARLVNVAFKDVKDGKARSLFLYVKRARGLMARWIIENRITSPERLADFDVEGYRLDNDASRPDALIFKRPQPMKKAA